MNRYSLGRARKTRNSLFVGRMVKQSGLREFVLENTPHAALVVTMTTIHSNPAAACGSLPLAQPARLGAILRLTDVPGPTWDGRATGELMLCLCPWSDYERISAATSPALASLWSAKSGGTTGDLTTRKGLLDIQRTFSCCKVAALCHAHLYHVCLAFFVDGH